MVCRCVILIITISSLTLLPIAHAQEPSPAERDFTIETIPGNTALVVDANKDETIYRPGGSIIDRIQKYVSIFAILGKNKDGKDVINITNFDKQSSLFHALPALLPQTLQERIRYPQDHLEGNELFPTVAGRACSGITETNREGKPLKTAVVGETFKQDFYELLSFATVYSAISGTIRYEENGQQKNGLTGLNLLTPRQEITVTQNNQHILTNPNILYPCGAQSDGRRVPQKELAASGSLAPGDTQPDKLFVSAPVPQEKLDLARFFSQLFAAGECAVSSQCRELAMALATNANLTFFAPGYVALAGLTYDTKGDLAINLEKENPQAYKRLMGYKGWTNTFRPATLTFAGSLTQEDGTTRQQIIGRAEASPEQETQSLKNIPWRGSHGVIKTTNIVTDCMIMPLSLQKECDGLPTDTSDWAQGDTFTGTPLDPAAAPFSGDFGELLKTVAREIGLPACVLDGVAMIEGGPNMGEITDNNRCLASANSCSAAGPMQFTTGQDAYGNASCSDCQSAWVQEHGCPNAWATWGENGNPCLYSDSLRAAARKLKNDGNLNTEDPIETQKIGIEDAGYHYYGSSKPVGRLGNRSYGEFLYAHCQAYPDYGRILP